MKKYLSICIWLSLIASAIAQPNSGPFPVGGGGGGGGGGSNSYNFNATQFSVTGTTNVSIPTNAIVTNLTGSFIGNSDGLTNINYVPVGASYTNNAGLGQPTYQVNGLNPFKTYIAVGFQQEGLGNEQGLVTDTNTFDGPVIIGNTSMFVPSNGYVCFIAQTVSPVTAKLYVVSADNVQTRYGAFNGQLTGSVLYDGVTSHVDAYAGNFSNHVFINGQPPTGFNQYAFYLNGAGAQASGLVFNTTPGASAGLFFASHAANGGFTDGNAFFVGTRPQGIAEKLSPNTCGLIADPILDWSFAVPTQITGETTAWNHPQYIFDITNYITDFPMTIANVGSRTNANMLYAMRIFHLADTSGHGSAYGRGGVLFGSNVFVQGNASFSNNVSISNTAFIGTIYSTNTATFLNDVNVGGTVYTAGVLGNCSLEGYYIGTSSSHTVAIDSSGYLYSRNLTPTSSSYAGNTGQMCYDSGFLYICVAPNSWRRVATSTF